VWLTRPPALFTLALLTALAAGNAEVAAQTYDPAADFSPTSNPNGVWQYGRSATLGGPLLLYPNHVNMQGLDFWQIASSGDNPPYVAHNGTASTILYAGGVTYVPGQLGMHPGPEGQDSVVRWTAPTAGLVQVSGSYYRLNVGTSTDVHVLKNGTSIFDGTVNSADQVPFSLSDEVLAGDNIDFSVGYGGNNYFGDSTGLTAAIVVQPTPEPSLILL